MKSLEDEIIGVYDKNIEKFSQLLKMIEKKLTTLEIEKTNMKVLSEYSTIIRDFEDSYKIFLVLIKSDDIFSLDIINKK